MRFIALPLAIVLWHLSAVAGPGIFEGHTDIGGVRLKGSVHFDSLRQAYRITGSGANMWGSDDAFFFAWRRVSGDLSLQVKVMFEGAGKNPHRKAGWMLRSGFAGNAPYVDALVHGDGLICMQYRRTAGGPTEEIQSPVRAPATLLLERTGEQTTLSVIDSGAMVHRVGTITLPLPGNLVAGLAVCSHDTTVCETAVCTDVFFRESPMATASDRVVESSLETLDIETGVRTVVRRAREHFEAPNWSRDGHTLYYNMDGRIFTIAAEGGTPTELNTGNARHCNNDHGLSPDGTKLALSHHGDDGKSRIFVVDSKGGEPALVTPEGPSYWHGWSPDGRMLAYCAERNGEFDVYTIPAAGGKEQRLTDAPGLDDGPDYSPDGRYIYFNSVRTGRMKIWRMNTDGSDQTQWTADDAFGDWFAHPSPDGKWLVFLSYDKSVEGHPPNKDVVLRIMPAAGGTPRILATLFGGQGTMNVPSWAPDSRRIAFVSYQLVSP